MNEFEYYFIRRKDDEAYPLICITGRDDEENPTFMNLEFNEPIPRNPVMADYLEGPEIFITEKIANKIKELNINGVKLISTELVDTKGTLYDNYFCLLTNKDIEAMDREKSDFEYEFQIYEIEKFVFDQALLKSIPLEDRLVFVLGESPEKTLFHRSVVDAIMVLNPTGMEFVNMETNEVL